MRSSKYHDYRVFKIALFIILVVLGLFIYIKCIRTPLEHTAPDNAWKVLTEATCDTDGKRCKVCTECGEEFAHEAIPATGHDIGDWKTVKKPTCTEAGLKAKTCKNCNKNFETSPIDATGHTESKTPVIQNYKASTCTVGGSKDNVYFCTVCKEEARRETVQLDPKGHTTGQQKQENRVEPSHADIGTYELVTYCGTCKEEIGRVPQIIEAEGHNYEWTPEYNKEADEFTMVGKCTCNEDGNIIVLSAADGLEFVLDESVPSCQIKRYTLTVTYEGETVSEIIEIDPDPHVIYAENNNGVITYYTMDDCVKYSDVHGRYFDLNLPGIHLVVDEAKGETAESVLSEDGYAIGAFKCVKCEKWFAVLVYSPEYDSTLPPKNDEE